MAIEILAALFVFWVPVYLLTEEIVRRLPVRAHARRRASAHRVVRARAPMAGATRVV